MFNCSETFYNGELNTRAVIKILMSSKRTKSITASLLSRNKEEKGANIECLFDKVYLLG